MEKARLIIDGLVNTIKEQIDGDDDWNSIAAFVQLDNTFGIAIWVNDAEDTNSEEQYYYNVELRWKIGRKYAWGELYAESIVYTNTTDLSELRSAIGDIVDLYDCYKGEVILKENYVFQTLWDIDDFDINTGGDKNVEDINIAEMEENFYKGYKG